MLQVLLQIQLARQRCQKGLLLLLLLLVLLRTQPARWLGRKAWMLLQVLHRVLLLPLHLLLGIQLERKWGQRALVLLLLLLLLVLLHGTAG
jgi:hypothetical protein